MAVNSTAIDDDQLTQSRRPNWRFCAPSGAPEHMLAAAHYLGWTLLEMGRYAESRD
jgi:hypothetical protein